MADSSPGSLAGTSSRCSHSTSLEVINLSENGVNCYPELEAEAEDRLFLWKYIIVQAWLAHSLRVSCAVRHIPIPHCSTRLCVLHAKSLVLRPCCLTKLRDLRSESGAPWILRPFFSIGIRREALCSSSVMRAVGMPLSI